MPSCENHLTAADSANRPRLGDSEFVPVTYPAFVGVEPFSWPYPQLARPALQRVWRRSLYHSSASESHTPMEFDVHLPGCNFGAVFLRERCCYQGDLRAGFGATGLWGTTDLCGY